MSQEPVPYITDPDAFSLEPEAPEDIDSGLVDALIGLAHLEPAEMASADIGEIAKALKEKKTPEPLLSHHANKSCQCLRINSLPPLPPGFLYGGIRVFIESEHDAGRLTLSTVDEGGGPFITLEARGNLSFDEKGLVAIGQVADALIRLHEAQES